MNSEWKLRDVVLAVVTAGWALQLGVSVWRGRDLPPPPPGLLEQRERSARLAYWAALTAPPNGRDAFELEPPPAPLEPRMSRADGIGARVVVPPDDRCYGKNCSVLTLTSSGTVTGLNFIATSGGFASRNAAYSFTLGTAGNAFVAMDASDNIWKFVFGAVKLESTLNSFSTDEPLNFSAAGAYLFMTGTAITTGAACAPASAFQWDTGSGCYKVCGAGLTWSGCLVAAGSASAINYVSSAVCFDDPCNEDANFTGAQKNIGGTISRVTCSWDTPGVVGGATGAVVQFWNATGAAEVCSCTLGACDTGANTPLDCSCAAALTGSNAHTFRLKSTTDCGTNPGKIVCTATITGP